MKQLLLLIACTCYFSLNGSSQTVVMAAGDSIKRGDSSKVFTMVEIEASFPGGPDGWVKYIQRNINADVAASNGAASGQYKVVVQFSVDTDGSISNIIPLSNCGYGMEAQVIKAIQNGPHWIPAWANGKPVKAYRIQPVYFMIQN